MSVRADQPEPTRAEDEHVLAVLAYAYANYGLYDIAAHLELRPSAIIAILHPQRAQLDEDAAAN